MGKIGRGLCGVLAAFMLLAMRCSAYALDFDAENLYGAIFVIYSGNSLGSGFALGTNCILTNAHVLDGDEPITVKTYSGETYDAKAVSVDEALDVAVLCVDGVSFPYLSVGDDSGLTIGDDVYAVGAPSSLDYTLTKGIISSENRQVGDYSYIQVNIALNAGNSGGPLLDSTGRVIGMNTLKLSDTEGIGFAIPVSALVVYLKETGIECDSAGNVSGSVSAGSPQNSEKPRTSTAEPDSAGAGLGTIGTALICGLAFLLPAACAVTVIVYRKNRTKKKKVDPSERTDFDIDIEE